MRKDMARLLVSRPRTGGWPIKGRKNAKRWRDDYDLTLKREPMSRGRGSKYLNENLNPLRRFLRSRVGRLWDDVYSELREHLRVDSAVQLHVFQHLWEFVERHVEMVDGVAYALAAKGDHPLGTPWAPFYIHPETRRLCESDAGHRHWLKIRRERLGLEVPPDDDRHTIDRAAVARRIDGVWYRIELKPLPDEGEVWDILAGRVQIERWRRSTELVRLYGASDRYGVAKVQLNKRALKQLGLFRVSRR